MSRDDQQRWDEKWQDFADAPFQPHRLFIRYESLLSSGRALDLACGRGQNAIWLAQHGYLAIGVDISRIALEEASLEAHRLGLTGQVHFVQADLDEWRLPGSAFELICVFRYLERGLFPTISQALIPGGLLFYATRHRGYLNKNPMASRQYLLEPGELRRIFGDWKIIHYEEGSEEAELVARKTD